MILVFICYPATLPQGLFFRSLVGYRERQGEKQKSVESKQEQYEPRPKIGEEADIWGNEERLNK